MVSIGPGSGYLKIRTNLFVNNPIARPTAKETATVRSLFVEFFLGVGYTRPFAFFARGSFAAPLISRNLAITFSLQVDSPAGKFQAELPDFFFCFTDDHRFSCFALSASSSARSVFSQGRSMSDRPKCP